MSKKVITAALAGIMSAGMVTPVLAAEGQNLDALNKAAYDATMKAEKEKTQGSVNAARAAIKALLQAKPDSEYIISLVGTYSEIVDGVQQPILSTAVTSVKKMNENGTQANINEAYTNLPEELKEIDGTTVKEYWRDYHAGLKAQIDDAQSALQVKTSDAVKKAQAEKTPEAIKAAQDLVTEVSTSVKPAIVEWAKIMQDRLDAIEVYTLKVTEVVRINKTTIDVKFDELAEELKDVTLTVKDSNGKVCEINTRDYVEKGATEASFTFKKALESDPTGTWTVNGVGYDATAQKFVDDVVAATTQQKLADTLSAYKGITGYNVNNVSFYLSALNTNRDKIKTVNDVQKLVVEAGNTDAAKQDKVSYIKSSANNVVLGQRMIECGIQRVNKEWLDSYNEGNVITFITSEVQTFSDIQARVDSINKGKIDTLLKDDIIEKTIENQKVVDAINLVEGFYPTDSTENENAKKTALGKLQIQKSIVAVIDATTPESVISALKKLANDDKTFAYSDFVNENLGKEYVEHINKAQVDSATVNTAEKIKSQIIAANKVATEKAIEDLNKLINGEAGKEGLKSKYAVVAGNEDKTDAKQKERFAKDTKAQADMEAAFNTLAKASAKQEDKFDIAIVNKTSYYEYLKVLGSQNTVPTISNVIKAVNSSSIGTLFNDVNTDNLMEKLNNAVSNYGLKNVNIANKAVYIHNITEFNAGSFNQTGKTQLEVLQNKVDKLNDLAIIGNKKSTEKEVVDALANYKTLVKEDADRDNDITGVSKQQLADVARLINLQLNKADNEVIVSSLAQLDDEIKVEMANHKTIMNNINTKLTIEGNKKINSSTTYSIVSEKEVVSAEESNINITAAMGAKVKISSIITNSEHLREFGIDGNADVTLVTTIKIPNGTIKVDNNEGVLTASYSLSKEKDSKVATVSDAGVVSISATDYVTSDEVDITEELGNHEIVYTKTDSSTNIKSTITVIANNAVGASEIDYDGLEATLTSVITNNAEDVLFGYVKENTYVDKDGKDALKAAKYEDFEQIRNLVK